MSKSIRIYDEDYKIIDKIAKQEDRDFVKILSHAIKNFAIAKKIK